MGSDNGCAEMTRGALDAAREYGIELTLVGDEAVMSSVLEVYSDLNERVTFVNVPKFIKMCDDSTSVRGDNADCSMVEGMKLLAKGEGDAFVTAGSTGAAITAATLYVKRIRGIRRAALAPVIPTAKGGTLLIDCGANVECTSEYLLQFAYMGSFYASEVLKKERPEVGLLNVGTEDTKGDPLRKETFALLKAASDEGRINFIGNVEARDVLFGVCDVLVADGFSGNVLHKSMEGVGAFFIKNLKEALTATLVTKLGALTVRKRLLGMRKMLNYKEIGGSPLVGVSAPVIKAHGSADAYTMKNAINQARMYTLGEIPCKITQNIEYMKVNASE